MSQRPIITYAPRHAAISAMIEVVATPPIKRFVEGEIRTLKTGDPFLLKARKSQAHYPNPTEWIATGSTTTVGSIDARVRSEFMAIWGDTDWLFERDDVVWVPAAPVSTADRELLIDAYCTEICTDPETASRELAAKWHALRERLG